MDVEEPKRVVISCCAFPIRWWAAKGSEIVANIKIHNLITQQGYATQSTTLSVSESFCSPEKYKEKLGYSRMYVTEFSLYFQLFGRSFQMPVSS